jgi:hypothetical protein
LEQSRSPHRRGLPDDLRAAIEEALSSLGEAGAAVGDLRSGALGRARDLLDPLVALGEEGGAELARRAEDARAELARRGTRAREASTTAAAGLFEAVSEALRRDSHPKPEGK